MKKIIQMLKLLIVTSHLLLLSSYASALEEGTYVDKKQSITIMIKKEIVPNGPDTFYALIFKNKKKWANFFKIEVEGRRSRWFPLLKSRRSGFKVESNFLHFYNGDLISGNLRLNPVNGLEKLKFCNSIVDARKVSSGISWKSVSSLLDGDYGFDRSYSFKVKLGSEKVSSKKIFYTLENIEQDKQWSISGLDSVIVNSALAPGISHEKGFNNTLSYHKDTLYLEHNFKDVLSIRDYQPGLGFGKPTLSNIFALGFPVSYSARGSSLVIIKYASGQDRVSCYWPATVFNIR